MVADGLSGVPPDYSRRPAALGQSALDWELIDRSSTNGGADRLRATFARFDMVRIGHFRGFVAFWEIPASEPTASTVTGSRGWHRTIQLPPRGSVRVDHRRGPRPSRTRSQPAALLGYPGMRVAQFGFDEGERHRHSPSDNYPTDVVAIPAPMTTTRPSDGFGEKTKRHDRRRSIATSADFPR